MGAPQVLQQWAEPEGLQGCLHSWACRGSAEALTPVFLSLNTRKKQNALLTHWVLCALYLRCLRLHRPAATSSA
jgi:hypothetical protein